jgi:small subunit ribosomal protein S16
MLVIRLQRIGKKHQPSFRIVVAERRSKLGSPPVEDLGFYNSFSKAANVNKERLEHWLKVGAKPTVTVNNFLVKNKVLSVAKLAVKTRRAKGEAEKLVAEPQKSPIPVAPTEAPPEKTAE